MRSVSTHIYLVGFMGAGKSSVGRILAEKLKRDFYDTDRIIEASTGMSIAEIFEVEGEEVFRDKEEAAIEKLSKGTSRAVVSLGGGAILRAANLAAIQRSGVSVYLKWKPDILLRRLKDDHARPLVANVPHELYHEELLKLFAWRQPYYEKADHVIECCEDLNEEAVADNIAALFSDESKN